jgi:hypothetical protein
MKIGQPALHPAGARFDRRHTVPSLPLQQRSILAV